MNKLCLRIPLFSFPTNTHHFFSGGYSQMKYDVLLRRIHRMEFRRAPIPHHGNDGNHEQGPGHHDRMSRMVTPFPSFLLNRHGLTIALSRDIEVGPSVNSNAMQRVLAPLQNHHSVNFSGHTNPPPRPRSRRTAALRTPGKSRDRSVLRVR